MLRSMLAAAVIALFASPQAQAATTDLATFAAGCYWCVESDFDKVKGVLETTPGFMGGETGHTEVVNVAFDPAVVTYQRLLDHYWVNVDLVDGTGQFCDRGSQYRPAIFVYNDEQRKLADASKQAIVNSKQFKEPVVVEINAASAFTPAPDPDYYKLNPVRYKFYRAGCGRDARLKQLWGDKAGH